MNNKLAIIIPAYKIDFIDETLASIASQTCVNFTLYIGDDCSNDDLWSIIEPYSHKIDIVYKRYESNIGRTDLVGHWTRCLDLLNQETWFCLFSDDDIMPLDFVDRFYQAISVVDCNVIHFNIEIINDIGQVLKRPKLYPEYLSQIDFFRLLYTRKIEARMPEFIFHRDTFLKNGGFLKFKNAIGTDNATVLLNAQQKAIYTIADSFVKWRESNKSVSSSNVNPTLMVEREEALIDFLNWSKIYFSQINATLPLSFFYRFKLVCGIVKRLSLIQSFSEILKMLSRIKIFNNNFFIFNIFFFQIWLVKRTVK